MKKIIIQTLVILGFLFALPLTTFSNQVQPNKHHSKDKPYVSNDGPSIYAFQLKGHKYLFISDDKTLIKNEWKVSTVVLKGSAVNAYKKYTNAPKFNVILFNLDDNASSKILSDLQGNYRMIN